MRPTVVLLLTAPGLLAAPLPFPKPDDAREDARLMVGTWDRLSCTGGSFPPVPSPLKDKVFITEGKIRYGDVGATWELKVGREKGRKTFDIRQGGSLWTGVYELKGDSLRVCFLPSPVRPAGIEPSKPGEFLQAFRRAR